jgi:hypothetical protein
MARFEVTSQGWEEIPLPTIGEFAARLRVLKDGRPFDQLSARITGTEVAKGDKHRSDFKDPFWTALFVLAAREVEERVRHDEKPSDSPVVAPSYQQALTLAQAPDQLLAGRLVYAFEYEAP